MDSTINIIKFKKIMTDKNVKSLGHLSRLTGISVSHISRMLKEEGHCKRLPSIVTIRKIIAALNLTPQESYDIFLNPKLNEKTI